MQKLIVHIEFEHDLKEIVRRIEAILSDLTEREEIGIRFFDSLEEALEWEGELEPCNCGPAELGPHPSSDHVTGGPILWEYLDDGKNTLAWYPNPDWTPRGN